jgi:hypothetical protein
MIFQNGRPIWTGFFGGITLPGARTSIVNDMPPAETTRGTCRSAAIAWGQQIVARKALA